MENHEVLTNNPKQHKFVFSKLTSLLKLADIQEVTFMVAFISVGGIYLIINELRELTQKKIKVIIITGFMNNFNQPKVFELLMRIENLEIRVANISNYHPKLYIVKHKSGNAYIIGSSNLTNNALRFNLEMNLYVDTPPTGNLNNQFEEVYQQIYQDSYILTQEILDNYKQVFNTINCAKKQTPILEKIEPIPNKMQIKALAQLDLLRQNQQKKALIISATGSGKTYLSAFDVKASGARKLLFIAHRESILNNAASTYHTIINNCSYGKISGASKDYHSDYIFATIQTLQKDNYLTKFKPDEFDYIVIDEVHRAGANSYQKIADYFKPKFLLGMSATPERNDDFDIYQMFDHNIAYEIRLNEALTENLVCPFHYFGISELMINGEYQDDYSDFNKIDFGQRVKHIIHYLKLYGYDGNKVKGLIFASRIEEAQKLSELFNLNGYKTACLSGANSDKEREAAIKLLENNYTDHKGNVQDYLDYIFTVDIFNEGVDIPCINQIALLRPTQSAIIFVQQLGRGLRKSPGKEYCVIIDFIGNYKSNFLIAVALSGNNSYDKENLRQFISEANSMIPINATVSFDRITQQRIYAAINSIVISKRFVDQKYLELKNKLNRIPRLLDFKSYNSIDPKIIFKYVAASPKTIFYNYYELLHRHHDFKTNLSNTECQYLNYISQELLFAARPDEIYVLLQLIQLNEREEVTDSQFEADHFNTNYSSPIAKNNITVTSSKSTTRIKAENIFTSLEQTYNTYVNPQKIQAVHKALSLETSAALQKKYNISLIDPAVESFALTKNFASSLKQPGFKDLVIQTLELGLDYFIEYKLTPKHNDFILYNKYSRKEVTRLLNVNLSLETSIYGYRIIGNAIPIFITYHKSSYSTKNNYENKFIRNQDLIWYSRPSSKIENKEIQALINHKTKSLDIMIFLKKSNNEGNEHYYLGNADVHAYHQTQFDNKEIVKFILRLHHPLPDAEFDYLVN